MLKFCTLYCTAKVFQYTKNKKILWCQKIFIEKTDIFAIFKKMALQNFFIFSLWLVYVVSKIFPEKEIGGHRVLLFQLHKAIGYVGMNFVRVYCHINELYVSRKLT
jgi:ATP sulfurylase